MASLQRNQSDDNCQYLITDPQNSLCSRVRFQGNGSGNENRNKRTLTVSCCFLCALC